MKKTLLYRFLFVSFTILLFISCTTTKFGTTNQTPPTIKQEKGYISIPIYYGTNRNKISNDNDHLFGGKWTDEIKYGYYTASIPESHETGKLEQPSVLAKLLGKGFDPEQYIHILKNEVLSKETFLNYLAEALNRDQEDHAFIFIHGYNNSFESSALRTAQLFYDLNYKGVPIMYSWPSTAKSVGYFKDGTNIEKSTALFETFILDIVKNNPEKKLNLIAHSMGNRLLVETINQIQKNHPNIKFENIIMAAPDVGKTNFQNNYHEQIVKSANQVNLYCSKKDKALNLSKILNFESRLGLVDSKIYINQPLKTIDITNTGDCEDLLSHTCFAQAENILIDIKAVLEGKDTNRKVTNGVYYIN